MSLEARALSRVASTEVHLRYGLQEAIVSPFGASLRGYYLHTHPDLTPIVTRYASAIDPPSTVVGQAVERSPMEIGDKIGGQGDVLVPFPGRVRGGRYTFEGHTYQMELNDKEGPNAIHGFLRNVPWRIEAIGENNVAFSARFEEKEHSAGGYPFAIQSCVWYRVEAAGLVCSFSITNAGSRPAPAAAGFHPYFTAGSPLIDDDDLQVGFDSVLEYDENLIPTGKVLPVDHSPLDFRRPRVIGETPLNTCFLNPRRDDDGKARIHLKGGVTGRTVTVWMDDAFDYVVLYSGDPLSEEFRRKSLAIEPMTCGSDAFNHPEWGLKTLAPGEMFAGEWGVDLT